MTNIIELKTTQTGNVKTLVDTLKTLLEDLLITFKPPTKYYNEDSGEEEIINGGIYIKEVNKKGELLISTILNNFEEYNYNYSGEKYIIGIKLEYLLACLKCMSNYDTMSWLIEESDSNNLTIILESVEKNEKKIFKIPLMDINEDPYDIEDEYFPFEIIMPTVDFQKYIKNLSSIGDNRIEIKCTETKLFLTVEGESGKAEFDIGETLDGLRIIVDADNKNDIVQGVFELKYLLYFTKCTSLCSDVHLFLKNDFPLIVSYDVGTLGPTKFILSPYNNEY